MHACIHVFAFEIHFLKTQLFSEMTSWHKEVGDVSELLLITGKSKSGVYVTKAMVKNRNQAISKEVFHF